MSNNVVYVDVMMQEKTKQKNNYQGKSSMLKCCAKLWILFLLFLLHLLFCLTLLLFGYHELLE